MKKIISIIITLSMIISLFQGNVFAAETPITFSDINLQNAFCSWLNQAPNSDVYKSAIKAKVDGGSKTLSFYNKNISSLSGMENLSDLNISTMDFSDNHNISDLSPLSTSSNLKYLNVQNNKVSNFDCLSSLPLLWHLSVNGNLIDNNSIKIFAQPGAFPVLTDLNLDSNTISDVTPLSGLSKILDLSIQSNKLTDVSTIGNLNTLTSLLIGTNNITDISSFKNLKNLTMLSVPQNKITDISCISSMPNLHSGTFDNNRIADITPLNIFKNTTMGTLSFGDNFFNEFSGNFQTLLSSITHWNLGPEYQNKLFVSSNSVTLNVNDTSSISWYTKSTTDGTTFNNLPGPDTALSINDVTYSVADPSIASVDTNGTITGKAAGTTAITVLLFNTDQEYTKQIVNVTVNTAPVITKGSVTLKYQDENGTDLEAPTVISDLDLNTYSYTAKSFTGYTTTDTTKSVTLTALDKDQTIIFNYTTVAAPPIITKGSVTLKYQDENGTDLEAPTVISNLDLNIYSYTAKNFTGYTTTDTTKLVILTALNKDQTIVFNYKKVIAPTPIPTPVIIKGSVTLKYQDENGKDLEAPTVNRDLDLNTYSYTAKNFTGYTTTDTTKSVTLTALNKDQTIIFSYKKNEATKPVIKGSYTVRYVDEKGNFLESETVKNNLQLMTYFEKAKNFEEYTLNDISIKTIVLSEEEPSKIIVFNYRKIENPITKIEVPTQPVTKTQVINKLPQTGSSIDIESLIIIGTFLIIFGFVILKLKVNFFKHK